MRITISSLFLSLVLTAGAAAQSAPVPPASAQQTPVKNPQAQAQLKEFTSPDGHCSIMMPGTAEKDSSKNMFSTDFEDGNVAYMLQYDDFPPTADKQSPAELLQKSKTGSMASAAGSTLLSESAIDLGGVPGLAYSFRTGSGYVADFRIYYTNRRLYQTLVITAGGYTAIFRDAFLGSFKIK